MTPDPHTCQIHDRPVPSALLAHSGGQDRLISWATERLAGYPAVACITLNFKQGRQMPHGWVRLTPEIARRQVKWLLRNVDRAVYGNGFKRSGSRTSRLVVNEGMDGFKRLHAHLAVGVPHGFSPVKFLELFENLWARANWGYGHGDVDLCESPQRWISYILKTGAQGLDTENTQFH